jgi:hypothetical protein
LRTIVDCCGFYHYFKKELFELFRKILSLLTMNILQIEENLSALQEQRRYLDQKIANKFQSLAKFENIRANSNTRLHNAIIEQNEKASMRNKELLTKLSQLSVSTVIKHNNNRHNCAQNLNDAKLEYQKKMEATLPFHYRQNAIQLEEKIKMLKIEKLQSQQRRERIRLELDNEDRAKTELEQQRRELMVLRALEQQDFLRSEANSAILHEEGRFVDESIAQQLGLATNVLNRMVSESKRNTIQMTKDYQLEHISQARQNDSVSIHLLPPLPSNQSHQTRLVNPSIQVEQIKSHLPDNAASDHTSQPTNTTNRSSSAVTVEIEAARHFQPTLQAVVELSPASSTDNSPIKSAPQSVERSRQIHFESSSNTPTVQSRNLSSSRLDDEGDDEFEFEAADLQEQTYLGVASENDTSLRSTAPPTLQFEKELPTTSSFELNDDEGQNPTPKSSPDHHHSRFSPQKTTSPHREEVDPWAKEEDSQQNQQHQQPEKMKEVKEMEFVQPEPVQQTVATPEDLRVLLNDVKQCVVCVRQLFAAIEHRVMFSAHVTSIYTFSSIPSISRTNAMVQYVSLLLGGGGLGERDRLLLEEFNGNERLVGDTVLAILQTHSALLVPK